jgi:hypothetical protein
MTAAAALIEDPGNLFGARVSTKRSGTMAWGSFSWEVNGPAPL